MMSDESYDYVEYGVPVFVNKKIVSYYKHRRITSMTITSESKISYLWELHLDCGHDIEEVVSKNGERTSPTGMYRDCPICERNVQKHANSRN